MATNFDVVIVGAGMVGESIALAIAKENAGLSVAIVDPAYQQSEPNMGTGINDYGLRVSALSAKSQAFLTQLGAWQRIPQDRLTPYTGMYVWDAQGTGVVQFDARDLHLPALGTIVENDQTQWALRQAVKEQSSIRSFAQKVRYIDNRQADGYTPVALENGEFLNAKLVIGADGALSRVRQWAGFATREWDYGHQAIVATVKVEQPNQATAWQRFRPEGPLAFLPMPHSSQHCSIVWSTSPEEAEQVLALSDADFNQALTNAFEGKLGQVLESSKKASITLRQRHAKTYWKDGVVLAGDAAHSIHPLAGQGVNLGFKDAQTLAEEIVRGANSGLDIGGKDVLAAYQRRRQVDNLVTMASMEGFKQLFAAQNPLLRLARNQGMRLFDRVTPLKQQVVMKAMGL
ncbi:MAG: UbiH/UbiF/VisC/COQ6 family ubiquinone biosynthesis hydroxylase [Venatoribacter sp.]